MSNQPKDAQEYLERFAANQKIEGFGLGNVHMHMPCPFCAAPDFLVYELLEVERKLEEGAVCNECGRGMKGLVNHFAGGKSLEFVQTCGPNPPDWLQPNMRRMV
jgi:hypothetical protein